MQIIELFIRSQILVKGTTSSTASSRLVDAGANFTGTVSVGDMVFNTTDNTSAKITAIDSDTQLTLDGDIMVATDTYEIFSDYVKMDLFEDESISINDSIQNVRDISKIFTTFSQQFNLPATKNNNKFFKHYYNSNILQGFDARYKTDAIIKLNGSDYRKGKIRLNTVDLKHNKAYSYKVVFFGDVIELKDVIQDDDLSSLDLSALDFTYDNATVYSKFSSTSDLDVAFPLVTHSKYFEIHTDGEYRDLTNNDRLLHTDLKPAVKVKKVLEAIESKYGLDFSNDFFNSTTFNNLYMLLHRASGGVSNALETGAIFTVTNSFIQDATFGSGTEVRPINPNSNWYRFKYTIVLASTDSVTVRIHKPNGETIATETFDTAGTHIMQEYIYSGQLESLNDVLFTVESENTLTITSQSLEVKRQYATASNVPVINTGNYTFSANTIANTFVVSRQLPKMKVIDFITSLFKLFNLTAYKENGVIVVRSLQDYYNVGNTYDITDYVQVDNSSVSKLLQHNEIEFKFKSKEYFLVKASDEIQNDDFGNLEYGDTEWDGKPYKVEVDFEKMMYERLIDRHNTPTLTTICQGSLLDSNYEPTIGAPLLLYCVNTNNNGTIKWGGQSNPVPTNYKRPSNYFSTSTPTLNFGAEMDEFDLNTKPNSIFNKLYSKYIRNIFDVRSRKLKVTAFLPLRILLNYNLNDTFIISGKRYRINTIKTNLLTNKTDLELFDVFTDIEDVANGIIINLPRANDFRTTAVGSTTIDTTWSAVTGAVRYWLYADDVNAQKQTGTTYQFTGLETGTTYKLGIQVEYTDGYSPIKEITVTTT